MKFSEVYPTMQPTNVQWRELQLVLTEEEMEECRRRLEEKLQNQ